VLVLAIAKTTNNKSYSYDLGQSVAILSLQAMAEGVYTHQMGGFDASAAAFALEITDEYKVLVVFTLGYLGELEMLHPKLQKLEMSSRQRRSISESVFTGSFGHKADFL
jgi:hypothetical protein